MSSTQKKAVEKKSGEEVDVDNVVLRSCASSVRPLQPDEYPKGGDFPDVSDEQCGLVMYLALCGGC